MADDGTGGNGFAGANGAQPSVARGESPAVSELTTPSARTRSFLSLSDIRSVEDISLNETCQTMNLGWSWLSSRRDVMQ